VVQRLDNFHVLDEKQIPFKNDNKKSKGKAKLRRRNVEPAKVSDDR
jgi:hypothetical protein